MKIAVVTNLYDECSDEDYIIAKSFAEDGHHVDILNFPVDHKLIKDYQLIVFKNAWDLNEKTYRNYFAQEAEFFKAVKKAKVPIVNTLDGKLDFATRGKRILVDLYKQGYNVVPTIDDMKELDLLPKSDFYIVKPTIGYDGFDMKKVSAKKISKVVLKDEVVQPKLSFKSEIQMYFVNGRFMYALKYSPSKWPDYPDPVEVKLNRSQIKMGEDLFKLYGLTCSFGRVDFLELEDGKLIMLEMADSNPNMSLPYLSKKTLNKFLTAFKKAVYEYMERLGVGL